jgi:predicted RNA-binding protein (virulence factor B family)
MRLGEINVLTVLRFASSGAYLGDDEGNDVLLPGKYIPEGLDIGSQLSVFINKDSEGRLIATTETSKIKLNGFAYLKVKEVNLYGAFLDWGLEKDLLVPFKEQNQRMEEGKYYLVSLQIDHATDRLYATMKATRYLHPCEDKSFEGKSVDILICEKTDLGVNVIVNDQYHGLIYRNDINQPLRRGTRLNAFVHFVRDDGKLDIRLEEIGNKRFDDAETILLDALKQKGYLNLNDKSDPDEIRETIGMSKKLFKQTIGKLYKARLIELTPNGIHLR